MIVGPYYFLFVCVWIYLRHYINLCILWAVCTKFRTVGPFELNWETEQYKCWISQIITFALLASLQSVNLFWLYLILRIAKNYLFSNIKEDERSDNEEGEDDDEVIEKEVKGEPEDETGLKADSPKLMVNGQPVGKSEVDLEPTATAAGVRERKKRKG